LQVQIVTGILLAMHYTPHVVCAGVSIEHILREVYGGWMLRHAHANGASLFFIAVGLHLFRGLAMGHAWRVFVWCLGVLLLLLSILTAFVGYVLPWGQMSFWGATVITSLASALPVVGQSLVSWLWGGLSVENATLNRVLSLHYLLPFIIAGTSVVHIAALHQYGSNHPLVGANPVDKSAFLTDTIIKDLVGWVLGAIGFTLFAFGAPIALGHPDNSIHANPLTTPAHIVPEWYFLALYAILRSIPNKQAGVVAVALVIFTLILLGWGSMVSKNRCVTGAGQPLPIPRGVYAIADALHLFWILGAGVLILGWSGSHCTPMVRNGHIGRRIEMNMLIAITSGSQTYSNSCLLYSLLAYSPACWSSQKVSTPIAIFTCISSSMWALRTSQNESLLGRTTRWSERAGCHPCHLVCICLPLRKTESPQRVGRITASEAAGG